jgi:hypothetical protein
MRRLAAPFVITCMLTFCAFNAYAQETQPARRKAPSLTMDNYESGRMTTPSNKNSNITPMKSETADSAGFVSVNARTVLEKTFAQLDKVKSMRTRLKVASESEQRETIIEVVRPNRVRMRAPGMEMISIGSTAYIKMGGEAWQKTANPAMAASLNQTEAIKMLLELPGVTISGWAIGEEVLEGIPTTVYDIKVDEQRMTASDSTTIRLWVGKDDLPRKMEFGGGNSGFKMSITYEEFNKNIVINAPTM